MSGLDVEKLRVRYPRWQGPIDYLDSVPFYWNIMICVCIAFLGSMYNIIRTNNVHKINEENQRLLQENGAIAENIHSLFAVILFGLAAKLNLSEAGSERVSIYVHRAEKGAFVPCGRYSHNPMLRERGRTKFPDSEGCISRAWQEGWHFANKFPEKDGPEYVNYLLSEYRIPRNTSRSLKMVSRCIAARRINLGAIPIAVIVVESTRRDGLDEVRLREALDEISDEYARMISAVDAYIPDPWRAIEAGL